MGRRTGNEHVPKNRAEDDELPDGLYAVDWDDAVLL